MRSLLTLSVLLALIREDNGQKPTVSLLPKFPDVFVGDDVTLICNGRGEPIQWFINGDQQSHNTSLMLLTSVTSKNDGMYQCERAGSKSDPYTLTVLELEPHAQLSPSVGGTVVSKGGGRNMVLQVEDDLKGWKCYVLRGESGSKLQLTRVEENKAVMFAELMEAKRATFWCKKDTQRSNAVTLKMTERKVMLEPPDVPALMGERVALRCAVWGGGKVKTAEFYKNHVLIKTITEDTYIIDKATQEHTGEYSCHATYRYSHISADRAQEEGDSDAQELKVIGGPPATTVNSTSPNSLRCSCSHCPVDCTSYRWYHTPHNSFVRQTLAEITEDITIEEEGRYSCRKDCGKGFSRFSNIYIYNGDKPVPSSGNGIMVAGILLVVGVLIVVVLVALKRRRSGGNSVQATARDKDKTTGGDYEQIQLTDQAVYHTLGEGTDKDKVGADGGYEALKKRQEEAVYHTLGAEGGQGQGEGQGEGQGGYEALKGVKAEVYQTLSSADSKTPVGESEGKYEQLPQKDKDNEAVTVEENPYEELKAGQQDKKEMSKEKE